MASLTGGGRGRRRALLFLVFSTVAFIIPSLPSTQEAIPKEQEARFENLSKEMDAAIQKGGIEALTAWARANLERIGGDFILHVARGAGKSQSEESLRLAQIIALEKGDQKTRADVFVCAGVYYTRISKNKEALDNFSAAEPLYVQLEDLIGQGDVYRGEGDIYYHTGDNAKAMAMYEKALPFYEKAQASLGRGIVYQREGDIYQRTGENAKALGLYEKALPYYERASYPLGQGNVCLGKGKIYFFAGDYVQAMAWYEKALSFYEKAQSPINQGNVYGAEGDIYLQTGENAKALAMYEKALPFFEKAQNLTGQGDVYQRLGLIYSHPGEIDKALAMYEKALFFFDKAQDPIGQGAVYLAEGNIYSPHPSEDATALAMYDKAISCFALAGAIGNLSDALLRKARILARQGRKAGALKLYEEALGNLEKVRAQATLPELKKSYIQKAYQHYNRAALFMLGNGYPERGYLVAESMKARNFLDTLAESVANIDPGLDPALKERRDALTARLSATAKAMTQARDRGQLQALKSDQDKLQAEFEALQTEIRLKNPAYASVRYPQPAGLETLQKTVLRPREVLVEYFLSEEKAFAFTITPSAFKAVDLPAGSKAIRSAVLDYLAWISDPGFKPADEKGRLAAGSALYHQILRPLEARLSPGSTLIIVPDGVLARLPFESLVVSVDPGTKRPLYLLEKFPLKYIQSASVLAFLRTQFKPTGATDAFIGFGDPVYDYESFDKAAPEYGMPGYESRAAVEGSAGAALNKGRYASEGGTLLRLEGSGKEVEEISDLFRASGQSHPEPLTRLRKEASEENAKAPMIVNYGYVHFACHGLLGDGFQTLALSQIPGSAEDGFLTLGEIMNGTYKAKLVVLSACGTGKGKEERGEGVTGLTRAVMYAGSPAAVVSLWSVSDAATRELMVKFYRNMIKIRLSKDEALRRAKLEMMNSVSIRHPYFWAAFVLYGE